jgi:hypothetical protein
MSRKNTMSPWFGVFSTSIVGFYANTGCKFNDHECYNKLKTLAKKAQCDVAYYYDVQTCDEPEFAIFGLEIKDGSTFEDVQKIMSKMDTILQKLKKNNADITHEDPKFYSTVYMNP